MKNKKVKLKQILIPMDIPKRKLELLSNKQLQTVMSKYSMYTQSTRERATQVYRDRHLNSDTY